jgi:hypothetical protein
VSQNYTQQTNDGSTIAADLLAVDVKFAIVDHAVVQRSISLFGKYRVGERNDENEYRETKTQCRRENETLTVGGLLRSLMRAIAGFAYTVSQTKKRKSTLTNNEATNKNSASVRACWPPFGRAQTPTKHVSCNMKNTFRRMYRKAFSDPSTTSRTIHKQ